MCGRSGKPRDKKKGKAAIIHRKSKRESSSEQSLFGEEEADA